MPRSGTKGGHKQCITWFLIYFSKSRAAPTVGQTVSSGFYYFHDAFSSNLEQDVISRFSSGIQYTELRTICSDAISVGTLPIWLAITMEPLDSSLRTSGTCRTIISKSELHTSCSAAQLSMIIAFPSVKVLLWSSFILEHQLTSTHNSLLSRFFLIRSGTFSFAGEVLHTYLNLCFSVRGSLSLRALFRCNGNEDRLSSLGLLSFVEIFLTSASSFWIHLHSYVACWPTYCPIICALQQITKT